MIRERRKPEMEREREREKCESHAAALIPACVHLCPSQTPRWASGEFICVRVTDRERVCAPVSQRMRVGVFSCALVCARVCLCELSQQG